MPQNIRSLPPKDSTDWYGHYTDVDLAVRELQSGAVRTGRMYLSSSSFAVSSGNVTTVPLDTLASDDAAYFTKSGNALGLTKAGAYSVTFFGQLQPGSSGQGNIFAMVNGTAVDNIVQEAGTVFVGTTTVRIAGSTIIRVAANSTLNLGTYFSVAGSLGGGAAKDVGVLAAYLG